MCRTWEVEPKGELSAAEIGALVAAMPRLCWLDLTGGEPLLRADFEQVVTAVLGTAPALAVLHFQTNGTFAARAAAVARRVRTTRPEVDLIVTVSIDGPPDLHDAIRGRAGAYRRAIETARALREVAGVDVHVGTTLTADNAEAMPELEAALERDLPDLDATRWHVNLAHRSAHFFANGDVPDLVPPRPDALIDAHLRRRGLPRDLVSLMESVYLVNLRALQPGRPSGIGCEALRSTVFVSPEGDVYPCHLYDRPLGNVRQTPFAEIWASAEVRRAREDIDALACGGCFSACEAYPAMSGAPLRTAWWTARRGLAALSSARTSATRLPVLTR